MYLTIGRCAGYLNMVVRRPYWELTASHVNYLLLTSLDAGETRPICYEKVIIICSIGREFANDAYFLSTEGKCSCSSSGK